MSLLHGRKKIKPMLTGAKQCIFNSRPQRKNHELLSMATCKLCHICLPPLFPLLSLLPHRSGFLAWVLPAVLPVTAGLCNPSLCHQVLAIHWIFPHYSSWLHHYLVTLWGHSLCLAYKFQDFKGFFFFFSSSKRWWLGPSKPAIILSSPLLLLFFPIKLLKLLIHTSPPYTMRGRNKL